MNREQKRMMQRKGQVGAEGASNRRAAATEGAARRRNQRATPPEFFRQVREELRQVAWPTRPETINYTSIVTFVLIFMTSLIFGLGLGFSKFVTFLFTK
ncbi:MAG TPA: preprotein translocase subunit SecE [Acidimicrobiales bacterium]